jgi:hypothetical protein
MDFEKAVSLVGTVTDLRRIASAHVIDHNQLKDDELRTALCKSKPQSGRMTELLTRPPPRKLRRDLQARDIRAAR